MDHILMNSLNISKRGILVALNYVVKTIAHLEVIVYTLLIIFLSVRFQATMPEVGEKYVTTMSKW